MKRKALFSALTSKFKSNEMVVVKGLGKVEPKTKKIVGILGKISKDGKLTIVLPKVLENVIRAARNLKNVSLNQVNLLNTYEILNGGQLIFMEETIERLKEVFLKKNGH